MKWLKKESSALFTLGFLALGVTVFASCTVSQRQKNNYYKEYYQPKGTKTPTQTVNGSK